MDAGGLAAVVLVLVLLGVMFSLEFRAPSHRARDGSAAGVGTDGRDQRDDGGGDDGDGGDGGAGGGGDGGGDAGG